MSFSGFGNMKYFGISSMIKFNKFCINLQAWSELFFNLGKALEPHMDNVVTTLLQKSADTNKFISDDKEGKKIQSLCRHD